MTPQVMREEMATFRWTHDRGVYLTMDTIPQVIHDCEMCCNEAGQEGKAPVVGEAMIAI